MPPLIDYSPYQTRELSDHRVHDQIDQVIDLYYSDAVLDQEPRSLSINTETTVQSKKKKPKQNLDCSYISPYTSRHQVKKKVKKTSKKKILKDNITPRCENLLIVLQEPEPELISGSLTSREPEVVV